MNKDEIRKLIGGYASGTLTAEEQAQLFEAALEDQDLFNELQTEQPLKELLDDPFSREQVRRAAAESLPTPRRAWFRRPWLWAMGASVTAAALTLAILVPSRVQHSRVDQVARLEKSTQAAPNVLVLPAPVAPRKDEIPAHPASITEEHQRTAAKPALASPLRARSVEPSASDRLPAKQPSDSPAPPPPPAASAPSTVAQTDAVQPPGARQETAAAAPQSSHNEITGGASQMTQAQPAAVPSQNPQQRAATEQVQVAPAAPMPQMGKHTEALKAKRRTTDEVATPVGAFRDAGGRVGTFMIAGQSGDFFYTLSRRLPNGAFINLPNYTALSVDEPVRVTVFPRAPGVVSAEEWEASTSSWKPLQISSVDAGLTPRREGVPIDIVVKKDERLRVTVGDSSTIIQLQTKEPQAR